MEIVIIVLGILLIAEIVYFSFIQVRGLQKQIESLQNLLVIQSKINDVFDARIDKVQDNLESFVDVHNNFVAYAEENFVEKGPKKSDKPAKEKVAKKAVKRGRPKKNN